MGFIPGTNVPTSTSGQGTQSRDSILAGHLYNAGYEVPEILEDLIVRFPNLWFNQLLESVPGVSGTSSSRVVTWNILERTRKGATVTAVANGTTATATLTLDIAAASPNLGYFKIGDEIRVANSGENGRVTAVNIAGGFQTIDVVRYAGGNWSTSLVNTNHKIGHIGTGFAPGSTASGGTRTHLPSPASTQMNIHRRGWVVERGALAQKTWFGENWVFKNEEIEQKEFMRDFQAKLLFAKGYIDRAGVSQTKGLMEYAEASGQKVTFTEGIGVQEADLVSLVEALLEQQGTDNYVVLCGPKMMSGIQLALADKYRSIPNSDKPAQIAGLDFQSYQILGKSLHFKLFDIFYDQAIVPQVSPTTTAKDFKNLALALDMDMVSSGERNIQVKYLEGAKFIQKLIKGMASPGPDAANAYDGYQFELLCEFAVGVMLPNRLGLLYSNG